MAVLIGIVVLCVVSLSQQEPCDQPQVTEGRRLHPKLLGYAAEELNSSFIISGYSLIDPLKMLRLAADGSTLVQLETALSPLSEDDETNEVYCHPADGEEGVTYRKSSKLYLGEDYKVDSMYKNDIAADINSEVQNIDFSKRDAAADEINNWVKLNTDNLIKQIVSADELRPDTIAIIVNALYFQGQWKNKFDNRKTQEDDFYVSESEKIRLPFMNQDNFYLLGNADNFNATILEIPFLGSKSKMKFVVPHNPSGLPKLLEQIANGVMVPHLHRDYDAKYLSLCLPKFIIETSLALNEFLESLGVVDIFNRDSILPYMTEENLKVLIDKVKQRSFIEVSESGVRAAAVNYVDSFPLPYALPKPIYFKLDHPFYFEIDYLHKVLFSGVFRG